VERIAKMNLRRCCGLILIELTVALMVLAIGLPALAQLLSVVIEQDAEAGDSLKAHFLATSLMSEISRRRFRESSAAPGNGVDAGEEQDFVRSNFDDLDDYAIFKDKWVEVTPPRDEAGNLMTNYSGFSQKVEVFNIAAPTAGQQSRSLAAVAAGSTDFKLVTVTISWRNGKRSVQVAKVFGLSL